MRYASNKCLGLEFIKRFSYSIQLSVIFFCLLIINKTIVGIFIFLAEKSSCSAMSSKTELAMLVI